MKAGFTLASLIFAGCAALASGPEITLDQEIDLFSASENWLEAVDIPGVNLSALGQVTVSMYTVHAEPGQDIDFRELGLEDRLRQKNAELYWDTIVRVNEDDEKVWVFVGMDLEREVLAAIAVFQLGDDEPDDEIS